MDFDLFDDEDDLLLTSVLVEPESEAGHLLFTDILPEFCCAGKDARSSSLSEEGFVKTGFINNKSLHSSVASSTITIGGREFNATHLYSPLNLQFLFGDACKQMQHLYACVRCGGGGGIMARGCASMGDESLSCYQRRKQVTTFLLLLLHATQSEQWRVVRVYANSFRTLMNRISEADTWKLIYFANSSDGNECNVPAYHLLHGLLEWKFLDLCLLQKYEVAHAAAAEHNNDNDDGKENDMCALNAQLERVVEDLLVCSFYLYNAKRPVELLHNSPFPCTCYKELWLLLQLALEKWALPNESETLSFWQLFGRVMERIKGKNDTYNWTSLAYCEFGNWQTNALTYLYGYRANGQFDGPPCQRLSAHLAVENHSFCESCVQQFLQQQPNEEQLRVYLCLLTPTLLQWWKPNVAIPTLLWEYFHKRLNSSFYIAGEALANLAVVCASGRSYVDRYRMLLQQTKPDVNLSSFSLFVLLLGKCLGNLLQTQSNHQALKLLGRIYTKFSVQKFLALNETGIHHLIELFLVLLLNGNFTELAPILREKLLLIRLDKVTSTRQIAVIKGHMAMLLLHAEHRCNIGDYVTKLLQQLLDIRNDLAVSKIMADGLLDIFEVGGNFACGEHLLLDTWLTNFLGNGTPSEQERTFEALHTIFVKMRSHELSSEAVGDTMKALNAHVLPFVKQQYATSYSSWMPQLAADFCISSALQHDTASFQRLFSHFNEAQTANRQCPPQFLLQILDSACGAAVELTVVMHVWLKSLVLLSAVNEDVLKLTRHVVKLPVFKLMTDLAADEVLLAKEPLCVFVAAVGKRYDSCASYEHRCQIVDNFNAYVRHFDRWLQPLSTATAAAAGGKTSLINVNEHKAEKNDVTFRFYSFVAIVIYNCAQIVYTKSKITCFFHVAITRFVLPTNVQMGKQPEAKLAHVIHKIWPVVVQGIGRLNFKTDPYIGKTLNDLIQKWTPHFKISPDAKIVARPFVVCVRGDNHELSLVMFERLTGLFLITQRRQVDPNACLVITIFHEVADAIAKDANATSATNECRLETLMKGCCLMMLEHIMMVDEVVPSRALIFDFFKLLTHTAIYKNSVRLQELLAEHLRIVTKKHLAYYTFFYFDLVTKLAQISPKLVERIMEFLLAEVRVVEAKRGAGEDNRIRTCLRKLQATIATASAIS